MNLKTKLSPHFTIAEMVYTSRRGDNTPSPEILNRLRALCVHYLEPIRNEFGPICVTSGYRCLKLNRAIGGARASAHIYGCGADFFAGHGASCQRMVEWIIKDSKIRYDQVIDEYSSASNWVHLGMVRPIGGQEPRRQALVMREGRYTTFA